MPDRADLTPQYRTYSGEDEATGARFVIAYEGDEEADAERKAQLRAMIRRVIADLRTNSRRRTRGRRCGWYGATAPEHAAGPHPSRVRTRYGEEPIRGWPSRARPNGRPAPDTVVPEAEAEAGGTR
ncbi:hypothetical protein ABT093_24010 [Kitasatospora sp. NPDC002551]|uniref:hypothetical protein n=1 Tax=Kitasatospora sp. NPDC002551 TaxID=3154539 RepID=UPI00331A90F4